jgi:hypothetical protein
MTDEELELSEWAEQQRAEMDARVDRSLRQTEILIGTIGFLTLLGPSCAG